MMSRANFIRRVGAILAIGAMSIGVGAVVSQTLGSPPQVAQAGRAGETKTLVSSKDDPKGNQQSGEIVVRAFDLSRIGQADGLTGMVAIDPTTGKWRPIFKGLSLGPGPVSPDGRYIVYSSSNRDSDDRVGIWVYDMKGESAPRRIFERNGVPHWTNDGQAVIIGAPVGQTWAKIETWRVNADGTGRVKLPIPETDLVYDCSRDGTWLVTWTNRGKLADPGPLTLVHPDGTGARNLTDGPANNVFHSHVPRLKISPDGRSVAYVGIEAVNGVRHLRLFVVDIDRKDRRAIPLEPDALPSISWSPDGLRLALNSMDGRTMEGTIAIVDLDGSNFRKLPLPPGRWNLELCDWNTLTPGLRVGAPDQHLDLKTPRGRYEALILECTKASQALLEELQKATTDDERNKIKREKSWEPRRYIGRFLEIAESAPNDPGTAADVTI